MKRSYNAEDMKKVEDTLKAYPNIYPLLEQMAACPDFDLQKDYTLTPSNFIKKYIDDNIISSLRASVRFLRARAKLSNFHGNRDEALKQTILILQLSRKFEQEPLIINYLVTKAIEGMALECANETLQAGPVSDQARDELDEELALHGSLDKLRMAFKSDRAYSLDSFRRELPRTWILSNLWQLSMLNMFDEVSEYSLHPYADWAAKVDNQSSKPKSIFGILANQANVIADLGRPLLRSPLIVAYRFQALGRAVRVINALQKKVPADNNTVPTMAELGLPDEVGIDPFNGKPLIIKKLPEGWLVYTVGENLKDDGGKVEEEGDNRPLDVGFGPITPVKEMKEKDLPK